MRHRGTVIVSVDIFLDCMLREIIKETNSYSVLVLIHTVANKHGDTIK